MSIIINGTPIDSLTKLPSLDGTEMFPIGRAWALSRNNHTN